MISSNRDVILTNNRFRPGAMGTRYLKAIVLLVLSLTMVCGDEKRGEVKKQPPPAFEPEAGLADLTLFLAGKPVNDPNSKLAKMGKSPGYLQYKSQIAKIWATYRNDFSKPLEAWRLANVPDQKQDLVFYPFAGPDFPTADSVYPDGQTYIMIGLEPAGTRPAFDTMPEHRVYGDLKRIIASMDYVARRTYFITSYMNQGYIVTEGVAPVLLLYLGLLNYRPYSVKQIDIADDGQIRYLTAQEAVDIKTTLKRYPSVEIKFQTKPGEPLKTILYFKQDVQDEVLRKDARILAYMKGRPRFSSLFKAASYLPHYETFSLITDVVLDKSDEIVLDDTGPRYKRLSANFDVTVFGRYGAPIYPFTSLYQQDLGKVYKEQKPEPIKFRYGYGAIDGSRGIMIARRKNADAGK